MISITRLVAPMVALVLLLATPPSWGQPVCVAPGCNPIVSDANGNTAGGTNALQNVNGTRSGGMQNTAFGLNTLISTTSGDNNTALGGNALFFNTTGHENTAIGKEALLVNNGSGNTGIGFRALWNNVGNL